MKNPPMPGTRVDVPVVPELAECLGYRGQARYVAFYFDADSDSVQFNDGNCAGGGYSWCWRCYTRHPAVEPLLRRFDLTSPDSSLCLVLDREASRASIATGDEAADFLLLHRLPLPSIQTEPRASDWREEQPDSAEVARAMQAQRTRVARLISWLDLCPTPSRDGRGT